MDTRGGQKVTDQASSRAVDVGIPVRVLEPSAAPGSPCRSGNGEFGLLLNILSEVTGILKVTSAHPNSTVCLRDSRKKSLYFATAHVVNLASTSLAVVRDHQQRQDYPNEASTGKYRLVRTQSPQARRPPPTHRDTQRMSLSHTTYVETSCKGREWSNQSVFCR